MALNSYICIFEEGIEHIMCHFLYTIFFLALFDTLWVGWKLILKLLQGRPFSLHMRSASRDLWSADPDFVKSFYSDSLQQQQALLVKLFIQKYFSEHWIKVCWNRTAWKSFYSDNLQEQQALLVINFLFKSISVNIKSIETGQLGLSLSNPMKPGKSWIFHSEGWLK